MCWNMLVGGTWYHNHNGNGDIYGCVDYFPEGGSSFENRCLIVHQPCAGEDIPDLASLVRAVHLQEHKTLRSWLANAPKSLRINVPRRALQVIDCEGRVAYHLPMKEELLHSLAEPVDS